MPRNRPHAQRWKGARGDARTQVLPNFLCRRDIWMNKVLNIFIYLFMIGVYIVLKIFLTGWKHWEIGKFHTEAQISESTGNVSVSGDTWLELSRLSSSVRNVPIAFLASPFLDPQVHWSLQPLYSCHDGVCHEALYSCLSCYSRFKHLKVLNLGATLPLTDIWQCLVISWVVTGSGVSSSSF